MYKLCNIFQFIVDGFYNRTLTEKYFVIKWHELVLHVAFLCTALEHLVPLYALVVADWDASAVDKTYASTPAETE